MKIGVLADTHSRAIPQQLLEDFREVEFIVHAGDFCSHADLLQLRKIKRVLAVFGNMDETKLRNELPESMLFPFGEFSEFTIGLTHGEGPPKRILEAVRRKFKTKPDAIIFGHSHQPFNEVIDGILYFNPGSPNDTVVAPYCSYGILEIKQRSLTGKIIKVD